MDKETAVLAIKFMERAQIVGGEVPAFCKVLAALEHLINQENDQMRHFEDSSEQK